jgi:hypothetical protein
MTHGAAPLDLCFQLLSSEPIGSAHLHANAEIEMVFNTVTESHEIQTPGSKRFKCSETGNYDKT